MLFGTAHDTLNGHGAGLASRPVSSYRRHTSRGLRGLSLTSQVYTSSTWMLEPIYKNTLVSKYGTIPLTTTGLRSPYSLVFQSVLGNIHSVTVADPDGNSVVLTIQVLTGKDLHTGEPIYTTSLVSTSAINRATQSVTTTQAPSQNTSAPIPTELQYKPSPIPPLDPGFLYVLPLGASKGYFSLFGISDDLVSDWHVVNSFILTHSPAIIKGMDNSTMGFVIPPSETSDIWEIKVYQTRANPNENFIGWSVDFRNLTKDGPLGTWSWTQSSGSGGFLGIESADWLKTSARVITDVTTLGFGEVARAGAETAGVSEKNIDLATEIYAAGAVVVGSAGGGYAILTATPEIVAATAFPIALDAGSATASVLLPTTAGAASVEAAGATLLPASLSLIAPLSSDVIIASAVGEGAVLAATAEGSAGGTSTIATATKGAVSTVEKAVQATVVSTAMTALSTEIKKLTGQLPKGAAPPSQTVAPGQAPAAPMSGTTLLKWGAGALAALVLLKKHSS